MEKDELTYHVPVLLKESVDGMNIRPDGTYVDVTFGGAGHSREILSRLGEGGRLLGFDQDEDAERNIVNDTHFTFVRSNFRYLHNFLRYHNIEQVDAILADLGVVGFILYYWFYAYLGIRSIIKLIKNRQSYTATLAIALLGTLMIVEWGIVSMSYLFPQIVVVLIFTAVYVDDSSAQKKYRYIQSSKGGRRIA